MRLQAFFSSVRGVPRRLFLPGESAAENALFLALILVGAAARLAWLGDVPAGLHQDEAAMGYDAWALLEHGMDRHGYRWPVHFVTWGSGQSALYAYLAMPFIKFLGLNVLAVRLPQALLAWPLCSRCTMSGADWSTGASPFAPCSC